MQFLLKRFCNALALFFYGNRDHGHWLYEKMQRPSTYFNEMINICCFVTRRPKLYRVVSVLIEPVWGCNLRCQYCWQHIAPPPALGDVKKRPHLMPWAVFEKAVSGLPSTVESVCLTGLGEPLLHPEIFDMIHYLDEQGFRVSLYTNGTLLRGSIADRLAAAPVSVVNISVEPDKDCLETYRQVMFEELQDNIHQFLIKKHSHTELKFTLVEHRGNIDKMGRMRATWSRFSSVFKVAKQGVYDKHVGFNKCIEPWLGNPAILTNGDVSVCCHSLGWPIIAGNVGEMTLGDMIDSRAYKNILRRFIKKENIPMICNYCAQFQGDCGSLKFLKSDDAL